MGWRDWRGKRLVVPRARSRDGWRVAGDDSYTCVAPAGFEKDPAVTAAIHSFDPEAIPAWRIQLWHPPDSDELLRVVHHGIMRHYPYPRYLRQHFQVEVPQGWDRPVPNFLDVFFDDPRKSNFIGPPAYLPWDWSVYRYCRAQYVLLTAAIYRERVKRHRERIERERARHAAELGYIQDHYEKTAIPIMEKITPEDWAEYEQLRLTRAHLKRRVSIGLDSSKTLGSRPGVIVQP